MILIEFALFGLIAVSIVYIITLVLTDIKREIKKDEPTKPTDNKIS